MGRICPSLRGCAALFILLAPAVAEPDPRSLFERGNQLYRQGEYSRALEAYRRILEEGFESGPLYYNIGNCHYKLGDLGRTILNYERAARLMPGDEDVRANLRLIHSLTVDDIAPMPRFFPLRMAEAWAYLLPLGWLRLLAGALWAGLFCGLIIRLLTRSPKAAAWSWRAAVSCAALFAALGATLAVRESSLLRPREGVILHEEVSVKSAPSEDAGLEVFTIHEGAKFRLDQQSDAWAEIVLPDGKVGWIPADTFEII